MVKNIVRDIFFLGQKSEPATKTDLQVGIDLQDTLRANRERCVGLAAFLWTVCARQHAMKIL